MKGDSRAADRQVFDGMCIENLADLLQILQNSRTHFSSFLVAFVDRRVLLSVFVALSWADTALISCCRCATGFLVGNATGEDFISWKVRKRLRLEDWVVWLLFFLIGHGGIMRKILHFRRNCNGKWPPVQSLNWSTIFLAIHSNFKQHQTVVCSHSLAEGAKPAGWKFFLSRY